MCNHTITGPGGSETAAGRRVRELEAALSELLGWLSLNGDDGTVFVVSDRHDELSESMKKAKLLLRK